MPNQQKKQVGFVRNPEARQIEVKLSRYEDVTFKKHFHETYSVGMVEHGASRFFHHNKTETIGRGMIALINPGEVHACNPCPDELWAYKMFYIDIELIRKIACELSDTDDALPAFTDAIIENPSLYHALVGLCGVILKTGNILEKDSHIHETLSHILLKHSDRRVPFRLPRKAHKATEYAYEYLMDNIAENVSLHQLSAVAGLSMYHLLRVFQQRFGIPPHTFQILQRINIAKKMLADGIPIIQVAFDLGFTDQSHFTRNFKTVVGATPRQYQLAL